MRATIVVFAAVAGAALVGCKSQTDGTKSVSPNCTTNKCEVKITVDGDCHNEANIKVDPPTLGIDKNNHGNDNHGPEIHFDIGTDHYTFASLQTGVVFNTAPVPPPDEFTPINLAEQGKKLIMKDLNSPTATPQTYKYTVNLLFNGQACAGKDPFIVNGN